MTASDPAAESSSSAKIDHAVVLLSGGLDSATVLAIAQQEARSITAMSFDYAQRHHCELEAAKAVAAANNVEKHVIMPIDLRMFGGSALTSDAIDVPKHEADATLDESAIPVTYVPARNTVFLSLALALAESISAFDIYMGVNAVDYSGYPDCRPEFIEAFEKLANLATKIGVEGQSIRIHAPLIHQTKSEIIQRGMQLGVDYALTHSCYDPHPESGAACGACDSCLLRKRGFEEAGVADPTRYSPTNESASCGRMSTS